jgi:putative PIN family toxin of toxin-antitoxin system
VRVVFDNNIVAGGVGWDGESYLCLVQLAHRRAIAYASEFTLNEARATCARLIQELNFSLDAAARLNWYLSVVRLVEPAPLGKQRSRDAKDDPYLAAALAARANFIVSYDKDLLELKKPFGIEIIRPAQLLRLVQG